MSQERLNGLAILAIEKEMIGNIDVDLGNVIELLLDSVSAFVPPLTDDVRIEVSVDAPSSTDMEIDVASSKGKGKAIATVSKENEASGQDASAALAKMVFIMKLLSKFLLMYTSFVHVLLRKDSEISSCRVPHQRSSACLSTCGIFHHFLHNFIPCSWSSKKESKTDGDWRHKLAVRTSQFLVASCVRSAEARKRVFTEINCIFNDFVDSGEVARAPTSSCISAEAPATFIDVGLVASLTRMLEVLDLDHAESPKVVTGLIKALELITKEYVHSADSSAIKGENSVKPADHNQSGRADDVADASQFTELASQSNRDAVAAGYVESFNTVQNYGGSEAVTDDMEHDQDLDGSFAPATEDDICKKLLRMEGAEDMSGDEGDGVDEDDDDKDKDQNDLEEDNVHHLSHPDTDQDDHEIDDDEFDDEVLDDDDEGGVIPRRHERTTSIYSPLGRSGENSGSSTHPLLVGPSSLLSASTRQSEKLRQHLITAGYYFPIFKEWGHSHRLNLWVDESQQSSGSSAATTHGEGSQLQGSGPDERPDIPVVNNENNENVNMPPCSAAVDSSLNADGRPAVTASLQGTDASRIHPQSVEMQFEQNDAAVRVIEAVSQDSSGSGATLGESLRSLDVEIGSADGHDDGGERQGMYLFIVLLRFQRILAEKQIRIFWMLFRRSCVLKFFQLSRVQWHSLQMLNNKILGIDPEFLAALPPDIRAEVLAQQQAQRLHQSQELEGQPVEMDTVSIIATFLLIYGKRYKAVILWLNFQSLVAEANMLRERFAHRYHNHNLFGMYPRSHRGESSRRGEGTPLIGPEALQAMVRLLRMVQPLYKGSLQKLLLNLCAHNETRTELAFGCQNNVMYSRPQHFDGVPPLVSRRVLETLTYLTRNHPYVAKILLQLRLPLPTVKELRNYDQSRGKALMIEQQEERNFSIALLVSLLHQPLYLRSIAHLEQLLNLLDVIIDHAERKPLSSEKLKASSTEQTPALQISTSDAENPDAPVVAESLLKTVDSSTPSSTSGASNECDAQSALNNLPQAELRVLCSLLAREGLSDNAYSLVAEVMKKLVAIAPSHCRLFISELADAVQNLIKSAMDELKMFSETVKALLSTTSSDGAAILRVLQALSTLVTSITEKEKDLQLLPETERSSALSQKTTASVSKFDEKHSAFVKFSERHRKLLNAFIRQNPGLLEKSFSLVLKVPRFVDFDNKRAHFSSKIKHQQHDHHHSPLRISVRRAYILEDSYNQLRMRSTQDLKGRLTVHFQGEEVGNESTFQPNSVYQTEHLSYFKFVGRVVGKSLFDGQLLDVHFTRSFYKHILGTKVTYHDIEAIDPDYFKNLTWMLEGINIHFNDKELELLISGLPEIDLDDMRANTEYSGYIAASPVIQWFWEVVQGFSKEDKARLLQFVTGTSKVPLEGFSALQGIQVPRSFRFTKHMVALTTYLLLTPGNQSRHLFNQLDLPEYPSKEHLEERLLLAIHEANEGFGFG
ncbi:L-ascorbate peroxidase T [Hibiscus syriacus]|uniref:HECT-type E3 ubiquitin transferase n=1 Tax=Hibiscus syriacus TaxID=106335 RepID=A0A6A3ATB1_HIBSY|nr:L-ascorbate peroxidase T [Hibiscus syriacus]